MDRLEPPPILIRPPTALQCPMCGADKAFTIDPHDESKGYCSAENRTWTIRPAENTKKFSG